MLNVFVFKYSYIEMFEFIEKIFKFYVLCGDFNSKNQAFGCKVDNENGIKLNDFLADNNTILLNNYGPTFHRDYADNTEI